MLAALLASLMLLHSSPRGPVVPVDTMVDVGGHRLHFRIQHGTVPVTIVLESGGAATLERWSSIDDSLARRTGATIVAYERAGFGRSELGPSDLSPITQARQLGAALEQLRVPGRRIFVGHSYGGLMAVLEAHLYPAQLAGVVLIDPMNTRFVDATGDFVYSTVPHITNPQNDGERAIERLVRTFGELVNAVRPVDQQVRAPMVVITSARSMWNNREREDRAWRASHEAMVAAAPGRRLVVAENSGHDVPRERPDVILDAVVSLVSELRTGLYFLLRWPV